MQDKIKKLIDYTLQNGGVSFNKNMEILENLQGYTISLQKYEYITKIDNINAIEQNIKEKINILNKSKKNNYFVGFWIYKGNLYIDINKIEKNYTRAVELAKKENQKAIFDNTKQKTIEIQKTQKTYILYEFLQNKNDIKYIKEFYTKKDIVSALNFSRFEKLKNYIYNTIDENINNYFIRNNKKYIILIDEI